ncbi:MAG: hypothetical protein CSA39_02465 [Flavobacteriales bacterium]|nr:MAG: hypothetical protein CSA39_02465 [Flavobacteriales bacterium]
MTLSNYSLIQKKLQQFIKKYYTNELLKGSILFLAFGLLYFLFTLFIEYFLWLPPKARTVLFFSFIVVEVVLLIKYIFIPVFKLAGLTKGITAEKASHIIGKHFSNVDDKLTNVLQLHKNSQQSELLLASIEQKSADLQPIPFGKAINFKANLKYLKYLAIPLLIWAIIYISGKDFIINDSFNRVVNYTDEYKPPAPFSIALLNDSLQVIEGKSFTLKVKTRGSITPENMQLQFNGENYFLKKEGSYFTYTFNQPTESLSFYLHANEVTSRIYTLDVIKTPGITGFTMNLNYPDYTGKKDELIQNTGNAIVPEGTVITWNIGTKFTDSVTLKTNNIIGFRKKEGNNFSLTKQVKDLFIYQINTSNARLKNYEKLHYKIDIIKDAYPEISVKSDIDSVTRGVIQFAGQLSDDYAISKLQVVYARAEGDSTYYKKELPVNKTGFETFYYLFYPGELGLESGTNYNIYFLVYDNDGVNGSKATKSQVFNYYHKTTQEINDDLLKEQEENLQELIKTTKKSEDTNKKLEEFTKSLKKKSEIEWQDKNQLKQFLERQKQYEQMFERNTDKLSQNLEEQSQNDKNKYLQNKKETLQKRIDEAKEINKRNDLLEQLEKMRDKLNREDLINKLDRLAQQNKQQKRTLERLLEMTKRFYIEQKTSQMVEKLDSLSKEQNKLSESQENSKEKQKELNKKFDKIREDLKELKKQNSQLVRPMDIPSTKQDEEAIEKTMKEAEEQLNNTLDDFEKDKLDEKENGNNRNDKNQKNSQSGIKKQKSAAKKQKQLSDKMNKSMMQMQGEMIDENIESLKAILQNLLTFSFDQEDLMKSFNDVDGTSGDFPKKLKEQYILKDNFEHIDDSLYTLSLRLTQIPNTIQKDLANAHYNIDKALENLADNRITNGQTNQHYAMNAANDMAEFLSNLLDALQNPQQSMGSGNGKSGQQQLKDIIKKQGELNEKMKEGMQDGEKGKEGKNGKGKEQMSGEQYRIYQEQNALKEALRELMEKRGDKNGNGKKAIDKMEQLEDMLLKKGLTNEVLKNMLQLEHELLKLKTAEMEQGMDDKRKANTNLKSFNRKPIKPLDLEKIQFNTEEILNRKPLPLKGNYKRKVQEYFNNRNHD